MKPTYEDLEAEVRHLRELLKQTLERIAQLEEQLKRKSKNSSKPPSTDQKSNTPDTHTKPPRDSRTGAELCLRISTSYGRLSGFPGWNRQIIWQKGISGSWSFGVEKVTAPEAIAGKSLSNESQPLPKPSGSGAETFSVSYRKRLSAFIHRLCLP